MNPANNSLLSRVGPGLAPEELELRALEAFDASRPGERVIVVCDRAPRALLARFQAARKGQFEWAPTQEGPGVFRVEVFRRKGERGSLRTVNDALSWDHDRLDELEGAAFAARDLGDLAEARALFSPFAFGLRRHIRFEEEILFPEFEAKAGFPSTQGPTEVMRDEHREILQILGRMEEAMETDPSGLDSLRHALHLVLGNHNLKEEQIVYPLTDQALTPAERDALVTRIQAL